MNRNQAKELLPIIKAFSEGKVIQVKQTTGNWMSYYDIAFNSDPKCYRIKPEPKYRPFMDAKECWQEMLKHQPFGWMKSDNCYYNIVAVSNIDVIIINVCGDSVTYDFSDALQDNTFADGTPFGILEEE